MQGDQFLPSISIRIPKAAPVFRTSGTLLQKTAYTPGLSSPQVRGARCRLWLLKPKGSEKAVSFHHPARTEVLDRTAYRFPKRTGYPHRYNGIFLPMEEPSTPLNWKKIFFGFSSGVLCEILLLRNLVKGRRVVFLAKTKFYPPRTDQDGDLAWPLLYEADAPETKQRFSETMKNSVPLSSAPLCK